MCNFCTTIRGSTKFYFWKVSIVGSFLSLEGSRFGSSILFLRLTLFDHVFRLLNLPN